MAHRIIKNALTHIDLQAISDLLVSVEWQDRVDESDNNFQIYYDSLENNPTIEAAVEKNLALLDDLKNIEYMQERVGLKSFRVLHYPTGGFIRKHIDVRYDQTLYGKTNSGNIEKACTLIFLLNDDFTGGYLCINDKRVLMKAGDAIIFTRDEPHNVTEVLSGYRRVLVIRFDMSVRLDGDNF